MARWDANLENMRWASLPQLQNVSAAKGMHVHPNSWHLGPLESSLQVSTAVEASPDALHDSLSMAGQRGDVTSRAAGLPLSHPAMSKSAGLVWLWFLVRPWPFPTLTLRWARRQKSTKISRKWLCRTTTSPPCLQVTLYSMETQGIKSKRGTQSYQHPHLATILLQSGTHWTTYVDLSPWKGPLTTMKMNEGQKTDRSLALLAGQDAPNKDLNWSSSTLLDSSLWVVGEARTDLAMIAWCEETLEL